MKKRFSFHISLLFFAIFLITPIITNAEDNGKSPYDMIGSDDTVIKFEDYSNQLESINTKSIESKPPLYNHVFKKERFNINKLSDIKPIYQDKKIKKDIKKIAPFLVIGDDGRSKVSNTDISPHRTISYLSLETGEANLSCTGTVIRKDLVLTNAHCVENQSHGSIVNAVAYPGVHNNHYSYGSWEMEESFVPRGWMEDFSTDFDYAVIKVNPKGDLHIGEVTGTAGMRDQSNLDSETISVYGYPGDLIAEHQEVSQWGMSGSVYDWNENMIYYQVDTAGGQSGAPILNEQNQLIGLHRGGWSDTETGEPLYNGGPKANRALITFVSTIPLTQ